MNSRNLTRLSAGSIFFEYGPISMRIEAWNKKRPLIEKCEEACAIAVQTLADISSRLAYLKKSWTFINRNVLCDSAKDMFDAVRNTADLTLTPMAAVAGSIADRTADWLKEQGATKVIVNNGGDIALRLSDGEHVSVGVIHSLTNEKIINKLEIQESDKVGGIATSGLGGRSFTRGIAETVTVIAARCAQADACATQLANASFISSPMVVQVAAKYLDPDTDIPEIPVTIKVDQLKEDEKTISLKNVGFEAENQIKKGNIYGAIVYLQGRHLILPEEFMNKLIRPI